MIKVAVRKNTSLKERLGKIVDRIAARWPGLRSFAQRFRKDNKFRLKTLAICSGMLVISVLLTYIIRSYMLANPATDNQDRDVITVSTDNPSEIPPGKDFVWKGRAVDPKILRLTTVGVEGYIQKVGVDQNTQIAVPNNVHLAGWFVNTARPGFPGLSIIDGHLNGTSIGGIFRKLVDLKTGDQFEVEMGDGKINKFRVLQVLTVDNEQAANFLFSQEPAVKSQLNLITCGGNYDRSARHYTQRVIVTAEFLPVE